jgi:molecular chaperone GrpE
VSLCHIKSIGKQIANSINRTFKKLIRMQQEEKDKETLNAQVENQESDKKDENKENVSEVAAEEVDPLTAENESLKKEVAELKDKHLRLYSEFDNFRKRTAKEKLDLVKTANEDVLLSMLTVLDDFERAQKSIDEAQDTNTVKEGIALIHHKLFKTLESKGLKPMESIGKEFDVEMHEAITQAPAPSEDMKGKVVTEVEKGYYLNDKVIRFAKVIIGV